MGAWDDDQCMCEECEALREAWRKTYSVGRNRALRSHVRRAARNTEAGLDRLLDLLHEEHVSRGQEVASEVQTDQPEHEGGTSQWRNPPLDSESISEAQQSPEGDLGSAPDYGLGTDHAGEEEDNKFMVCDHCRGHGLHCSESAVCYQCKMFGVGCVHRICRLSPNSKEVCPRPNCRYLHRDHCPVPDMDLSLADYIILPGRLTEYRAKGRVRRISRFTITNVDYSQVQEDTRQAAEGMGEVREWHTRDLPRNVW
ncbi:hypothetical protein LTR15_006951 [Elasticomyces elasticus]|nr:hypothetical protein LTR15_006951 [Elasticomyces elasticus]